MPMTMAKAARPSPIASARGIGSLGASSCPRGARPAAAPGAVARGGDAVVSSCSLTRLAAARLLDEGRVDRGVRIGHGLGLADGLPELARLLEDVVDRAGVGLR